MNNQILNMNLNEAIKEANNALSKLDSSPFSDKAYSSLNEKIGDYIGTLITDAIKISKRHKADVVSQNHIEEANDNLISKRKGRWKFLAGTIGGVFLGATASNSFSMLVLNTTFSMTGIISTIIIGIIGSFLIAINLNNG